MPSAAAEVTVGGDARMGVQSVNGEDAKLNSRIRIKFTASGMSDNGVEFGGSMRADQVNADTEAGGASGGSQTGTAGEVFINGPFGKVAMGDTDGAFDWALDETAGAGSITDDHTGHDGYSNGGNKGLDAGQVLRYENSFGEVGFAASISQDKDDSGEGDTLGFGVNGSMANVKVGVGFQSNDAASIAGMSATTSFGDLKGVLNYSKTSDDNDSGMDVSYAGLGMTYETGPVALNVNFGKHDYEDDAMDKDGVGAAAQYDLGGGLKAQLGFGTSGDDRDSWSLGLNMSF